MKKVKDKSNKAAHWCK